MDTLSSKNPISREPLLNAMQDLAARSIDCRSCRGECCTSKSNSMQITKHEGEAILADLETRGLLDDSTRSAIALAITDFRLDIEIPSYGARRNLRRTYTCPLYREGRCMVTPAQKPFGCLAFNPTRARADGLASGCRSDQKLLAEHAPEGEKAPIPIMLRALLKHREQW